MVGGPQRSIQLDKITCLHGWQHATSFTIHRGGIACALLVHGLLDARLMDSKHFDRLPAALACGWLVVDTSTNQTPRPHPQARDNSIIGEMRYETLF